MASRKAASAAADSLKKRKREKVEDAGRSRKRKPQDGEEAQAPSPAKTEGTAKKGASGANGAVVKAAPRAKADRSTTWKVSEPMGGAMTDIDPIFSADEEYVMAACIICLVLHELLLTELDISSSSTITPSRSTPPQIRCWNAG